MQSFLLALLNPVPGQDDAFNRWYDSVHVPDIMAMRGVTSIQRFVRGDEQVPGSVMSGHRYLALCEVSDTSAFIVDLNDSYGTERMRSSNAVDSTDPSTCFFVPILYQERRQPDDSASSCILLAQVEPMKSQKEAFIQAYESRFQAFANRPGVFRGWLAQYDRHWRSESLRPACSIVGIFDISELNEAIADWRNLGLTAESSLIPDLSRVTVYHAVTERISSSR